MQQTDQPYFALHVRIIAFIFSACMLCSTVMAHSLDFRCLDTSTGLADSHVSTIIKDRNGFLWIGTAAGLSRYDGFRFKNYILQVRVVERDGTMGKEMSELEIHISLKFSAQTAHLVMPFDKDKMQKVMNNLLSNAYKFTPDGGTITVDIRWDSNGSPTVTSGERRVLISVADTGCGISDDDKLHVFDRFYQTRHRKESPFGGSGLGLNIASEYVAMHGGRITVADNMENGGNGTVFTIELPVTGSGGVLASEKEAS